MDWSQNDFGKSTVAAYSLRGLAVPTVSLPVGWDEVAETAEAGRPERLTFLADDAVRRSQDGDLFAPVLSVHQALPARVAEKAQSLGE